MRGLAVNLIMGETPVVSEQSSNSTVARSHVNLIMGETPVVSEQSSNSTVARSHLLSCNKGMRLIVTR
jgi:hypothetical protein